LPNRWGGKVEDKIVRTRSEQLAGNQKVEQVLNFPLHWTTPLESFDYGARRGILRGTPPGRIATFQTIARSSDAFEARSDEVRALSA
jgi:hypothetical protein